MDYPLIIFAGPTGVGKTSIAIAMAEQHHGEIIGADSMQIYRYMDIGTAKPTPEERRRVRHHLIDIRNPDEEYSAADYARDAAMALSELRERGKFPFIVGGTGLYIHALLHGIFEGPGRDEVFREKMRTLAETEGKAVLHDRLTQVDPHTAARLHPHDLLRVIRALEVYHITGQSISAHQAAATIPLAGYQVTFIVLTAPREKLYERINARVEQMIAAGMVEEVQGLLQRGYHANLPAMNALGYKELTAYLAGDYDMETAVDLMKRHTRRYAKRQFTWFRKYSEAHWIATDNIEAIEKLVKRSHYPPV